jgi:hypothetical protein
MSGIIQKPRFHMDFFIKDVLNVRDTNTAAEKYSSNMG